MDAAMPRQRECRRQCEEAADGLDQEVQRKYLRHRESEGTRPLFLRAVNFLVFMGKGRREREPHRSWLMGPKLLKSAEQH